MFFRRSIGTSSAGSGPSRSSRTPSSAPASLMMGYNWFTKGYPIKLGLSFTGGTDVTVEVSCARRRRRESRGALAAIGVTDAQINTLGKTGDTSERALHDLDADRLRQRHRPAVERARQQSRRSIARSRRSRRSARRSRTSISATRSTRWSSRSRSSSSTSPSASAGTTSSAKSSSSRWCATR